MSCGIPASETSGIERSPGTTLPQSHHAAAAQAPAPQPAFETGTVSTTVSASRPAGHSRAARTAAARAGWRPAPRRGGVRVGVRHDEPVSVRLCAVPHCNGSDNRKPVGIRPVTSDANQPKQAARTSTPESALETTSAGNTRKPRKNVTHRFWRAGGPIVMSTGSQVPRRIREWVRDQWRTFHVRRVPDEGGEGGAAAQGPAAHEGDQPVDDRRQRSRNEPERQPHRCGSTSSKRKKTVKRDRRPSSLS